LKVDVPRVRIGPDAPPQVRGAWRASFGDGVRAIGFTALGTLCWGVVTGVALVKGGLSPFQALGMVMLVYSGTAQLAALPLMSAGAALVTIWATALLANLRFVVYSATVATEFRGLPLWRRLALGWMTTDTALAAYFARGPGAGRGPEPVALREARFIGANAIVYGGWSVGTLVGVALAGLIPESPRIGWAASLAIVALVGPMLVTRAAVAAAAAAGVVAVLCRGWPWNLGVFAAIAAGVAVALWMPAAAPSARRAPEAR
jgi:predicted branched-subunit amino acid permease